MLLLIFCLVPYLKELIEGSKELGIRIDISVLFNLAEMCSIFEAKVFFSFDVISKFKSSSTRLFSGAFSALSQSNLLVFLCDH